MEENEVMGWKLAVLGKRELSLGFDGLVKGWEIIDRQELGSVNCWILFLSWLLLLWACHRCIASCVYVVKVWTFTMGKARVDENTAMKYPLTFVFWQWLLQGRIQKWTRTNTTRIILSSRKTISLKMPQTKPRFQYPCSSWTISPCLRCSYLLKF